MNQSVEIEHFLAQYDEAVFVCGLKLRSLILKHLPNVVEQLDLPARMIGYSYGQKYADMICTIIPSKKGLKLGFYKGMKLPDPNKILKGDGKISRYVEINPKEELKTETLINLLAEAQKVYHLRQNK